ncbi:unnamed protein product [Microthlaspi erraticum]|uniref:Uncharacterized protein n=1 Tax=Microthlaspi erraticum TaxID=1685480 RepID=A0A6D2K9V1_9BRAS|nr:unnamed protein product [Microthlaspi erraticum]
MIDSIELEFDSIELPIELVVRAQLLSSGGGFMSFGPAVQKIRRYWLDSTHQLDRPVSNSIELLFQESKSNPKNVASL